MARPFVRRLLRLLLIAAVALPVLGVGALLALDIPRNAAGMAAKGICSAAFVAQRPPDGLLAADVLPASRVLALISATVHTLVDDQDGAGHAQLQAGTRERP